VGDGAAQGRVLNRAVLLFVAFGAVVLADLVLAWIRGIAGQRLLAAFLLATLLLWSLGALLGWLGMLLTYNPSAGGLAGNWSGFAGGVIGGPLGGMGGAMLGIALAERAFMGSWPRVLPLALSAVLLLVLAAFTVAVFSKFNSPAEQAGRAVFVIVPLFGAAAVLGWLLGVQRTPT
jgi:hypothetical protein